MFRKDRNNDIFKMRGGVLLYVKLNLLPCCHNKLNLLIVNLCGVKLFTAVTNQLFVGV